MARTTLAPVLADLREQVQARIDAVQVMIETQREPHPHQLGQVWAYGVVLALLDGAE